MSPNGPAAAAEVLLLRVLSCYLLPDELPTVGRGDLDLAQADAVGRELARRLRAAADHAVADAARLARLSAEAAADDDHPVVAAFFATSLLDDEDDRVRRFVAAVLRAIAATLSAPNPAER